MNFKSVRIDSKSISEYVELLEKENKELKELFDESEEDVYNWRDKYGEIARILHERIEQLENELKCCHNSGRC